VVLQSRNSPVLHAIDFTSRQRDEFLVLDVVSLSVAPGDIYCLLGSAGAGKTAVLHAFLGFLAATSGRALVAGEDAARLPLAARRHITYIPRGSPSYGALTTRQNLEFHVRLDGHAAALKRNDSYQALRLMGIRERDFEVPMRHLPRAVHLLAWLAVGWLKGSPAILIDEPTDGLDLQTSVQLQAALTHLQSRGTAMLIATSDVLLASHVATKIGIMREGRNTRELTRQEFVGRPLHDIYLEWMGGLGRGVARPFDGQSHVDRAGHVP